MIFQINNSFRGGILGIRNGAIFSTCSCDGKTRYIQSLKPLKTTTIILNYDWLNDKNIIFDIQVKQIIKTKSNFICLTQLLNF